MKSLMKSFGYAFRGIGYALVHERNMRIHFVCMVYMYTFLAVYDFFQVSRTQLALLFLAKRAGRRGGACQHRCGTHGRSCDGHPTVENAKIAKDTAAGAVLCCAIFAVAVGIAVLGQRAAFEALLRYYLEKPSMLLILILSIAAATVFIFKGFGKRSKTGKEENRL